MRRTIAGSPEAANDGVRGEGTLIACLDSTLPTTGRGRVGGVGAAFPVKIPLKET